MLAKASMPIEFQFNTLIDNFLMQKNITGIIVYTIGILNDVL